MNRYIQYITTFVDFSSPQHWLPMLILLFTVNAWGGECPLGNHDINYSADGTSCVENPSCSYGGEIGSNLNTYIITTQNAPDRFNVNWSYVKEDGDCDPSTNTCEIDPADTNCIGIDLNVDNNPEVTFSGIISGVIGAEGCFKLTATSNNIPCSRSYRFHITANTEGWGEPHITTVDGVNYDFQSAGEFIALRGDGVEIQTRQTPVSTSGEPRANRFTDYTELVSCVSIYTAVAATVGSHRVSIQPIPVSTPDDPLGLRTHDPSGVQIRVDGVLRTLGPEGIDLSTCDCPNTELKSDGRIVLAADEQSIEIHYADGTKLVVTPWWWPDQQKWGFDISVFDTSASEGIMGSTVDGWLPALDGGASLGPRPEPDTHSDYMHERYVQLNERFANSWRVTDADSLFYYAPGTTTASFTMPDWPRENPTSCLIDGEPISDPEEEDVAEEACKDVLDVNNRGNCIFDVMVTGETGFADAYVRSEQLIPGATRTTLLQDNNSSRPGEAATFTATVQRAVSTIGTVASGRVQFALDGKNVGDPIEFDVNGNAVWSTANLAKGSHEIEAKFLPTGFGERFRPSSSKVTHVVSTDSQISPDGLDMLRLSLHAGPTIPNGDFSDDYDSSYSAVLDLEYKFTPTYSFLGLVGYNHFEGARDGVDDTYWTNLSANVKYYFYRFADYGMVWVNAGAGAYVPESDSTRAGANFGIGLGGNINPEWRWEVGVNQHNIFTSGSDVQFTAPTIGVSYNFW